MSSQDTVTNDPGGAPDTWLDTVLCETRSPPVADAGFSAAVLARIATAPVTLASAKVLVSLRRADDRERAVRRWTVAGTLVGALVAALAGAQGSVPSGDPTAILVPGLALLVASSVMAWLAISRS